MVPGPRAALRGQDVWSGCGHVGSGLHTCRAPTPGKSQGVYGLSYLLQHIMF